jgi:hypothetical protein
LQRPPHDSSAHWFDEPATGLSGSLRLVLIVAVLVVLTFISVAWFCSHPPFRSIDYYLQSPIVIHREAPDLQTPPPPPVLPAPPTRAPFPNP